MPIRVGLEIEVQVSLLLEETARAQSDQSLPASLLIIHKDHVRVLLTQQTMQPHVIRLLTVLELLFVHTLKLTRRIELEALSTKRALELPVDLRAVLQPAFPPLELRNESGRAVGAHGVQFLIPLGLVLQAVLDAVFGHGEALVAVQADIQLHPHIAKFFPIHTTDALAIGVPPIVDLHTPRGELRDLNAVLLGVGELVTLFTLCTVMIRPLHQLILKLLAVLQSTRETLVRRGADSAFGGMVSENVRGLVEEPVMVLTVLHLLLSTPHLTLCIPIQIVVMLTALAIQVVAQTPTAQPA